MRKRVQERQELLIFRHSRCLELWRVTRHDFLEISVEKKKVKGFINYNVPAICQNIIVSLLGIHA